jgi:hypothetical protein
LRNPDVNLALCAHSLLLLPPTSRKTCRASRLRSEQKTYLSYLHSRTFQDFDEHIDNLRAQLQFLSEGLDATDHNAPDWLATDLISLRNKSGRLQDDMKRFRDKLQSEGLAVKKVRIHTPVVRYYMLIAAVQNNEQASQHRRGKAIYTYCADSKIDPSSHIPCDRPKPYTTRQARTTRQWLCDRTH